MWGSPIEFFFLMKVGWSRRIGDQCLFHRHLGAPKGPIWSHFAPPWGPFWFYLGPLGPIVAQFWIYLGSLQGPWPMMGAYYGPMVVGPCLGPYWSIRGHVWAVSGQTMAVEQTLIVIPGAW